MAKSALLSMAKQINNHYIPLNVEHKSIYIGVILCGKVKELEDGEWALHIVVGMFETSEEKTKYTYGEPNIVFRKYLRLLNDPVTKEEMMSPNIQVTVNSNRQFQRELELSIAQNYPDITPKIIIRKALDAFQTTTLVVSGVNLLVNIIRLILDLKKRHPNAEIEIELLSGKKLRSLKITTEQSLDVNEVIKDFMGKNNDEFEG